MRILIDGSNLFAGGGIQVAVSFLSDLNRLNRGHNYHVVVSSALEQELKWKSFLPNFTFYKIKSKHNSIRRKNNEIKAIEKIICPDVVFVVFGPSYYKSSCPKIVGFAIPHLIYTDSPYFKELTIVNRSKLWLLNEVKRYFFIKNSDALVFETDEARNIFTKKLNPPIEAFTVSNTVNEIFFDKGSWADLKLSNNSAIKILCLAANYPHKNLKLIPSIIDSLKDDYGVSNFSFVISQTKEELNFPKEYDDHIYYLGKVNITFVPSLYSQIDYVLIPTLLEVFSASYLEAMYMGKPIIASDMGFARDICRNSALYNGPLVAQDYADSIKRLISEPGLGEKLVENGRRNLARFGSSMHRTKNYIKIIEKMMKDENDK